jgi:DNA replication licensing factor MCM4
MQETPEAVPEGETPQTVHMCAYEDLVDYVKPGDRCEVVGIYRALGIRTNPHVRTLKNIYRTYIDVIGYTKTDSKRYENGPLDGNKELQDDAQANDDLHGLEEEAQEEQELGLGGEGDGGFTKEKVAEFHKLAQNPLVYDLLIDALAPSIWECHDVKKGILCQLFGGCSKSFSSSGRGRFRGEINILLCGDPSTAKSQLL